jgi:hypothetical protein
LADAGDPGRGGTNPYVPRASLNYLSIYIAEAKGFFRDEGLDNQTIVIGGPAAIAALVSGNVDFSGAGGSGLRAAAMGAELKAILYQTEKVTWYFVVHPSIKQVGDLKGKKVGVGLIGDSEDRFSTMFVERGGLSAKDITRIPMTSSALGLRPSSLARLAAVLDPGGMIGPERGLGSSAFRDLFPSRASSPTRKSPRILAGQRWVRAMVRALFLREHQRVGRHRHKETSVGQHNRAMLVEANNGTRAPHPGVRACLPRRESKYPDEIRVPMKMDHAPAQRVMELSCRRVKKNWNRKGWQ